VTQTPILFLGFNRPRALLRRLNSIEQVSPRNVRIYLDGPKSPNQKTKNQEVRRVAEKWSNQSRHFAEIIVRDKNMGVQNHMPESLADFIQHYSSAIVIEDDIEFSEKFIQYNDANLKLRNEIFSIQGFNPLNGRNQYKVDLRPPLFFNTRIPTIWGWGANAASIEFFLEFRKTHSDLKSLSVIIKDFASWVTKDGFLQNAITATWLSKMDRVLDQGGGSWDNWWALACWASGRNCLMPKFNMSQEEFNQSEGQTHQHEKVLRESVPLYSRDFNFLETPSAISRKYDRSLLRVWGINRKYSWAYSLRVNNQIRELLSKVP